jgi:hypothetical protein
MDKTVGTVCAKRGFIHGTGGEGKLFLKARFGLVLTPPDDYGTNCCPNVYAFSPL